MAFCHRPWYIRMFDLHVSKYVSDSVQRRHSPTRSATRLHKQCFEVVWLPDYYVKSYATQGL